MRNDGLAKSLRTEQSSIAEMIAEIATPTPDVTLRSAAALAQVRRGIITGEGPTVAGRVHFSRSIDADDTTLCARILILAGRAGDPVSRAEADALFDINAVAGDRRDGGRFDDLLAKAVVHHVMAACGHEVPSRDVALAPAMELNAWASEIEINAEVRYWLEKRMREMSRGGTAPRAIAEAISGGSHRPVRYGGLTFRTELVHPINVATLRQCRFLLRSAGNDSSPQFPKRRREVGWLFAGSELTRRHHLSGYSQVSSSNHLNGFPDAYDIL